MCAQKFHKNGLSLQVGTEYLPEQETYLEYTYIFTPHAMYGASIGYERRLSRKIALEFGGGYFYSRNDSLIEITDEEDLSSSSQPMYIAFQRAQLHVKMYYWLVHKKKYSFTPGVGVIAGSSQSIEFTLPTYNYSEKLSPEHKYLNLCLHFTNRFTVARFKDSIKGQKGTLDILVTPSLLYNVVRDVRFSSPIWQLPEESNKIGGAFWLGAQINF
jgi:hypothetical protein